MRSTGTGGKNSPEPRIPRSTITWNGRLRLSVAATLLAAGAGAGALVVVLGSLLLPAPSSKNEELPSPLGSGSLHTAKEHAGTRGVRRPTSGTWPDGPPPYGRAPQVPDASTTGVGPGKAPTNRERVSKLTARWDSESVDPKWGPATRLSIMEAWQRSAFDGTVLRSVDCRSTVCRLELAQDASSHGEELAATLGARLSLFRRMTVSIPRSPGEGIVAFGYRDTDAQAGEGQVSKR
jgi:hypothetical protein